MTQTITPTITQTITPTMTQTITPTITQTITPTRTPTMTQTITPTMTQTITPTMTQTITPTITPTITQTMTPTITPTITRTITPSNTPMTTQTITPSHTITPSYSYPSIFTTTSQAPGAVSLINPQPSFNQPAPNFITTPSFLLPAFLFSATTQVPQSGSTNGNYIPINNNPSMQDYAANSEIISPTDSKKSQVQNYTPSNGQMYSDINGLTSANLLAPYSGINSPLIKSAQTAEYYANTPIDTGTLYGALQPKYGFYK